MKSIFDLAGLDQAYVLLYRTFTLMAQPSSIDIEIKVYFYIGHVPSFAMTALSKEEIGKYWPTGI